MDLNSLRAQAADTLAGLGEFPQPWIRRAFLDVERHLFIPETVWTGDTHTYRAFHRTAAPEWWARAAYDPTNPVVTQVDDGETPADGAGQLPSSSISAPNAVCTMLAELAPHPGDRILEIGAATGYNAAMLAWRCGAKNITTVEYDPALSDQAGAALTTAGYGDVTVVCADGEYGYPAGAPYDRILATASVQRVPASWIAQATDGGRIVTPFHTALCSSGMATLTVNNGTAHGNFSGAMTFMTLRGQRHHTPIATLFTDAAWEARRARDLDIDTSVLDDPHALFALGLRLPGVSHWTDETGTWLCSTDSWALLDEDSINQWGPRDLADELCEAAAWWQAAGRPEMYDFGLTISSNGTHHTWLGKPERTVHSW